MSTTELEDLKERRTGLNNALHAALRELSDQYSSLPNLVALFDKWFAAFPDEYKQCYAGMSLADLASVLVQVQLCTSHHPLRWKKMQDESEGIPGTIELRNMSNVEENVEETPLYRMVDKVLIPAMEDVLQQNAFNLVSSKHSKSMSTFYRHVTLLLPKNSILVDKLNQQLVSYFRERLADLAIPVVKAGYGESLSAATADVQEALAYASGGQLYRIQTMVENLLADWAPVLGDLLVEVILDFVSSQFLFLLSSLRQTQPLTTSVFRSIWKQLKTTGWLENPENMIQAAPIRAAATVYLPAK